MRPGGGGEGEGGREGEGRREGGREEREKGLRERLREGNNS